MDATPLIVLTGFLGSGKTTLLSRLLAGGALADAAVLVNELGEVAIDHHLVADVRGDMVVLDSGCVCCTVREDLAAAIAELLDRRARGEIPAFTRIVLETTGAADPEPIVHTVGRATALEGRVMVDAVIATLALPNAPATLEHPEARSQLALADRIVLTKPDLATEADRAEAHRLADLLAPTASRAVATHGELDAGWALAPGLATVARRSEHARGWLESAHGPCDHHHAHHVHAGAPPIRALSVTLERPVRWSAFALWASMVTQLDARRVLRIKAVLDVESEPLPVAFHAVQGTVHPPAQLASWPAGPRISRIVVLTRGIDDAGLGDLERTLRDTARS